MSELPTLKQLFKLQNSPILDGMLLALDPGETTGFAVFSSSADEPCQLVEYGQLDTSTIDNASYELENLITKYPYKHVVMEDYRVYNSKARSHVFSDLHTPRVIGILEFLCTRNGVTYNKTMATLAKGFCTDDKLKFWQMYFKGIKHCRDAIRHGIYYLLFTHGRKKK